MRIIISAGTGEGSTPLAAFDAALLNAGVGNYNLICLSSIVPPESTIECAHFVAPSSEYGHRLYVVIAQCEEYEQGKQAWAGLGWTQAQTGHGLIVEQHGSSEAEVEEAIRATLQAMVASRSYRYDIIKTKIVGIECRGRPVCSVVVAVFASESWLLDGESNSTDPEVP